MKIVNPKSVSSKSSFRGFLHRQAKKSGLPRSYWTGRRKLAPMVRARRSGAEAEDLAIIQGWITAVKSELSHKRVSFREGLMMYFAVGSLYEAYRQASERHPRVTEALYIFRNQLHSDLSKRLV